MKLGTVENIVHEAYRLLGDVEDVVGASGRIGYGLTVEQASTLADVRIHLAHIKIALRRMEYTASPAVPTATAPVDPIRVDEQTATLADIGQHLAEVKATLHRLGSAPATSPKALLR